MNELSGFLIIDKPSGITSHDVVNKLRRILQTKKVGHAGTLDPLATGVLVMAVGKATRLLEYCVGHQKTYLAEIELGKKSDTYDVDGEVESVDCAPIELVQIEKILPEFTGKINQLPPIYSAKKINGKKAMDLARRGETPEMRAVMVEVFSFEIIKYEWPILQCRITVSAGTYIRSIAHDLGVRLGCGGVLRSLRREVSGGFDLSQSISLESVKADKLLPMEVGISDLPRYDLTESEAKRLYHGQLLDHSLGEDLRAGFFEGRLVSIIRGRQAVKNLF